MAVIGRDICSRRELLAPCIIVLQYEGVRDVLEYCCCR